MSTGSHNYGTTRAGKATREKIHKAVRRLLVEAGWGKFTRIDLARVADTSPATIYNYVSSLQVLTLNAYGKECRTLRDACEETTRPVEFIKALATHITQEAIPIAIAIHPMTVDSWQPEDNDAPEPPLSFEELANQLGELIRREDDGDEPGDPLIANSQARAMLYAVLTALIIEDHYVISALTLP